MQLKYRSLIWFRSMLSSACRPEKDTPFGGSLPILAVKGSTPPPEIVNILKSKAHRLSKLIKLIVSSRNLSTIISDLDGFQSVKLRSDDDRNRKDNDTCLSLKIFSLGQSMVRKIETSLAILDNDRIQRRWFDLS